MKRPISFFLAIFSMAMIVLGQDAGLVPDFKNQPMLLDGGKLTKLEKQTVELKVKAKAMGYGGASNFILLLGESSPVRVSNKPVFYIKVDEDIDPESVYYLTKITKANKNGREIEMMRTSAFAGFGAKGKSTKKDDVALEFTKVAENIYSFTPTTIIEPGEYAFINVSQGTSGGNSMVFAFGVN